MEHLTIRQRLKEILKQGEWTSLELSKELSVEEKEIYTHLHHVKKSLGSEKLVIRPYQCLSCHYVFTKRARYDRPGRCPKCRATHIRMATFSLSEQRG
ncbi:MAG: transcriptional regulator [Desulfopila sp.]|jgi:predicted Zn-ribbon and HTH transcriptional regulator|nr:transcriptional regulator [Desulfopila sp.]